MTTTTTYGNEKYRLRYDLPPKIIDGHTLYQIEALRDFGAACKGSLGGYIQSEDNLSQEGNCWVFDSAMVYGDAHISDNALIYDTAKVFGKAQVYGSARVFDNTIVRGNAQVFKHAFVCERAQISGNANVGGFVDVGGKVCLFGYAHVEGHAIVLSKNRWVYGPNPEVNCFDSPELSDKIR